RSTSTRQRKTCSKTRSTPPALTARRRAQAARSANTARYTRAHVSEYQRETPRVLHAEPDNPFAPTVNLRHNDKETRGAGCPKAKRAGRGRSMAMHPLRIERAAPLAEGTLLIDFESLVDAYFDERRWRNAAPVLRDYFGKRRQLLEKVFGCRL